MTRERLAERIEVAVDTLYRYEKGERILPLETLALLSEVLATPLADLLGLEGPTAIARERGITPASDPVAAAVIGSIHRSEVDDPDGEMLREFQHPDISESIFDHLWLLHLLQHPEILHAGDKHEELAYILRVAQLYRDHVAADDSGRPRAKRWAAALSKPWRPILAMAGGHDCRRLQRDRPPDGPPSSGRGVFPWSDHVRRRGC